ncbi:hypothetical protein DUNSADRAFT_7693 [Dunaliella salina]|uniref:Uncharacterized protein n=1 Tax=Dunaliella salina TaxID=3046 RepID=A0ABQ7GKW7_DUNSA|nr:hypothetical protein DUNSADRAFT_7693 [Dunaliella salina]|eukprot:KAF5835246.1 hypothetical protein DUNSADRAFT_7693 [Dunaliella salina]
MWVTLTGYLPLHSPTLCKTPHSPYNPPAWGCSRPYWVLVCPGQASALAVDLAAAAAAAAADDLAVEVVAVVLVVAAAAALPVPAAAAAAAAAAHAGHALAVDCTPCMLKDPACQ